MLKEVLLVSLCIAGLVREGQGLGSSCGGRELGHSRQTQFWLQSLKHEEKAAENNNPGAYKVFRNVKDYGAKGDGTTDDSNAINLAISQGDRCGPGCGSSTISPAIVYFPPGKYLVSRPLLQFYFTQFIGDPHDLPVLVMAPNFSGGLGLVDSDEYLNGPNEIWTNQNNFYRQVRNLIIDMTKVPANKAVHAIHWQVAQATSITNVHVKMAKNSKHQGIWMENGSGGFMSDLTFDGGDFGLWVGNQQFTSRNITVTNANTAIYLNWDWGWTFKGLRIENCKTGLDMTAGGENNIGPGSALIMDTEFVGVETAVKCSTSATSKPASAGTVVLDNVSFKNVQKGVQHTSGKTILDGGNRVIKSWGQGHVYERNGQHSFKQGDLPAPSKSAVLLDGRGNFVEKSKPTYTDVAMADFVSVKDEGAKGDGRADDTKAIQSALNKYAGCKVIFFPTGEYVITDTVYVPPGSRIIGEIWSTILVKGNTFGDQNNPKPAIQVGKPGESGIAEISEMVFSTSGPVPGAIVVQINMKEGGQKASVGLWDCHFRIGGAKGTQLQSGQCGKGGAEKPQCMGAHTMLHITGSAYLENVWAWVADHDLDGPTQVSLYNGRGILIEGDGPVWGYGTASEHSVLYQYNIANAKNVILGMIQTETAYYQAYPKAPKPFHTDAKFHDPDFSHCPANSVTCPMGWGLIIQNSENIYLYGAGLYNFFQNYDQGCLKEEHCQDSMLDIEKSDKNVYIYNLNTKASESMVNVDGQSKVKQIDNRSTFCSTIAAFLP